MQRTWHFFVSTKAFVLPRKISSNASFWQNPVLVIPSFLAWIAQDFLSLFHSDHLLLTALPLPSLQQSFVPFPFLRRNLVLVKGFWSLILWLSSVFPSCCESCTIIAKGIKRWWHLGETEEEGDDVSEVQVGVLMQQGVTRARKREIQLGISAFLT